MEHIKNIKTFDLNEALNHDEKLKIEAKIELLEFSNATYDYHKSYKDIHEAYKKELEKKLK